VVTQVRLIATNEIFWARSIQNGTFQTGRTSFGEHLDKARILKVDEHLDKARILKVDEHKWKHVRGQGDPSLA